MATHTLIEVAKLAGVSRTTVSRVINGHPSVRPEVRERVWRIVRQVGYQPHAAARSLVTKRSNVIGLLFPRTVTALFTDQFFPLLMRGIADVCNLHGWRLMLSLFTQDRDQDALYRQVLRSSSLDGVIVATTPREDPLIPRLIHDGLPFVVIGRHPDELVSYVDSDNLAGSRAIVEHLVALGHQRIATITGPLDVLLGYDRLEGYKRALRAHGLPHDPALVVQGNFTEASGRAGMELLLPQQPTAVFAASDMMAIGAIKVIKEAGLRVPQDISVVGFDDLPVASIVEPALTTVRQPINELGRVAAETLLSLIHDKQAPQHIVLPTELIIRASCGRGTAPA